MISTGVARAAFVSLVSHTLRHLAFVARVLFVPVPAIAVSQAAQTLLGLSKPSAL